MQNLFKGLSNSQNTTCQHLQFSYQVEKACVPFMFQLSYQKFVIRWLISSNQEFQEIEDQVIDSYLYNKELISPFTWLNNLYLFKNLWCVLKWHMIKQEMNH